MPLFEYECPKCKDITEVLVRSSKTEPVEKCTKCNTQMKRIMSLSSFHLKGGGWYATDYKNKSKGTIKKNKGEKEPR